MILHLLLMAVAFSLCITAIYVSMWDGMIFGDLRLKLEVIVPYPFQKPLYECLICMASFWTFVLYITIHLPFIYSQHLHLFTVAILLPFFCKWFLVFLMSAGINTLIYPIIGNAEDKNGEHFVLTNMRKFDDRD